MSITTVNIGLSSIADTLIGNRDGSTVQVPMNMVAAAVATEYPGPQYPTRAELYADLNWPADTKGIVWSDETEANRGQYRKTGASGAGAWVRFAGLPQTALTSAQLNAKLDRASALVTDFNTITVPGSYRGFDAAGTPFPGTQVILEHRVGTGNRMWQVAYSQLTGGGAPPKIAMRYIGVDGIPGAWDRLVLASEIGSAALSAASAFASAAQGQIAERALRPAAGSPVYLFADGSGGAIYDFTDAQALNITTTADLPTGVSDLLGGPPLLINGSAPVPVLDNGRLVLRTAAETDQLLRNTPLLPANGDVILAWSHKSEDADPKVVMWQHQTSTDGRVLITANVRRASSGTFVSAPGRLQVYMQGVTDGGGEGGGISHVSHPVGLWTDFVLVLKTGEKASQLWANGQLVDTFTRHATIPQVVTAFLRHSSQPGAGGRIGRILCLHRAPAAGELDLIRSWLRQGWSSGNASATAWVEPTITATAAILHSKPIPGHDAGEIWSKAGDTVLRPASMTKLLTTHVALNWLKNLDALDTQFTRTSADATGGSGANLNVGDRLDLTNALANLGLPSSNVTANVVARVVGEMILADEGDSGDGYARFVTEMNAEAARIGMDASVWNNPTGGDGTGGGNFTTARDMARLCVVAGDAHPEITSIWANGTWPLVITGTNPRTVTITHSVDFIEHGDPRVTWGKTGTTPLGGNCLLCEFKGPKGNRFYYVAFASTSDVNRFSDADAVYSAAEAGIDWPSLIPQRRSQVS